MEPWYKVVTPRKEVREGRSFNPDEFAIALEQVVAGTAPEDYRDPAKFFARTCFTRALRDHTSMVLRRLSGQSANTAPVLTLITQFGGGKTHTLTTLYHLGKSGDKATEFSGVSSVLSDAGLSSIPKCKVGVFVGNAWDPKPGAETPWHDIARQIAGDKGIEAFGGESNNVPPGTEAIGKLFRLAGSPVLILFDEVLNFVNRHGNLADPFYSFLQNLTVATTGASNAVAMISLPRSQVEMTDSDLRWQDRITKIVRRVSKDLIANDEAEISEVVRRRLFEDLTKEGEKVRAKVSKAFADWCFERRAQLPSSWTAVDSAASENKAREFLQSRFEMCYPFHPATLSVFQRKWAALPQYQQTRGTLAMLAQWISCAQKEAYRKARTEPLLTLGSAPLDIPEFRSIVLGQLGETRLQTAIDADIAGQQSHARALDVDTREALKDIHKRVGTAILFESSGGQIDKMAHLPELRFAIGEPEIDTTSVDNAALALETKAFFIRKIGSDGFQIKYKPTLKKVVSDRRASLDDETDIQPALRATIKSEFERGRSVPVVFFPADGTEIQDSPRLTIVVMEPRLDWNGNGLKKKIAEWTFRRGNSPRLYPGSLVWVLKKPGREINEKVESWLAWKRVEREIIDGSLGSEFDRSEKSDVAAKVKDAEQDIRDEVWASYRFVVLSEPKESDGMKVIDLGAGHASAAETLCGRIVAALKSQALLNESVGSGYIERNWPPALKEAGAWPLSSLRQSFLNGALTRLIDPDHTLRIKIIEFVERGDFGLASGTQPGGTFNRVWFNEPIRGDEVEFASEVFLLLKSKAKLTKTGDSSPLVSPDAVPASTTTSVGKPELVPVSPTDPTSNGQLTLLTPGKLRLSGSIPPEVWNRLGTKLLPKLRAVGDVHVGLTIEVVVSSSTSVEIRNEIEQAIQDLGLTGVIDIKFGQ